MLVSHSDRSLCANVLFRFISQCFKLESSSVNNPSAAVTPNLLGINMEHIRTHKKFHSILSWHRPRCMYLLSLERVFSENCRKFCKSLMAVIDATDPLIICVGFLEWVLWIEVMICPVLSPVGIYLLYSSGTPQRTTDITFIYTLEQRSPTPGLWTRYHLFTNSICSREIQHNLLHLALKE